MATYGLHLTSATDGVNGLVVDIEADSLIEAIHGAERLHPGYRVVRGQRKDGEPGVITDTDIASFSRRRGGALPA